jgi:hypothetical protein
MNERIKELAGQTGIIDVELLNDSQSKMLAKFAELIVKECIGIVEAQKESLCEDENTWCDRDYGYEMAVNDSVDMVKKHFGVEE